MTEERLGRMEDKLEKLSKDVYAIARMEERMLSVFRRLENIDGSIKKMDDRVDEIENQALIRGRKNSFRRAPVLDGRYRHRWFSFHIFAVNFARLTKRRLLRYECGIRTSMTLLWRILLQHVSVLIKPF